jgi:hypothetical protein
MAFAGFDMHDVTDCDLPFFGLGRNLAPARRDDENLIAVVDMPSGRGADAEVDYVAAKILRLSIANNRLPRPAHRVSAPTGNRRRSLHRFFRQFIDFEYPHDNLTMNEFS